MKNTLVCILLTAFCTPYATAQITSNWVVGNGYFSDPASWNNGVPVAGDTAILGTGGTFDTMFLAPNHVLTLRLQSGSNVSFTGTESLSADFAFIDGASALNLRENTGLDVGVLRVADNSDGSITVTDQNTLKVTQNAIVGRDFNTTGFLSLNSAADISVADLTIAQSGNASVTLAQASTGFAELVRVGHLANSNGSLTVAESEFDAEEIIVGYCGFGNLVANNSSQLDIGTLVVGKSANSDGMATIVGDSNISVTNSLEVGMEGGSTGVMTVGSGSVNVFAGELVIANQGNGNLKVDGDGDLQCFDASIGKQASGVGTVEINGDGSWDCLGNLTIGEDGSGDLIINSGTVSANGFVFSSAAAGSASQILIDGPDSVFNCDSDMVIGFATDSTLEMTDNATLNVASDLVLASENGSSATADLSSSNIFVGQDFIIGDLFSNGSAEVTFSLGQVDVMGDTLINSESSLEIRTLGFQCPQMFNAGLLVFEGLSGALPMPTRIVNSSEGTLTVNSSFPMVFSEPVENNGEIVVPGLRTFVADNGYSGFGTVFGGGITQISGPIRPGNDATGALSFNGDVLLASATLIAQIDSQAERDRLLVTGQLSIIGSSILEFDFGSEFSPVLGETYTLCCIGGIRAGEFANYSEGDVVRLDGPLATVISYQGGVSGDNVVLNVVDGNGLVTLGDVNLDGVVNLLDVQPFVLLVSSSEYQPEADCNPDGSVNLLDVSSFVDLLIGG